MTWDTDETGKASPSARKPLVQNLSSYLFVVGAMAGTQSIMAQEPSGAAALEEIIVTATRREQTLQEIPYSISVHTGDALERSGITSLNGLAQIVPGLLIVNTGPNTRGSNNNLSMRGLRFDAPGSVNENFRKGSVSSVSTYLGETPLFFPLLMKDLDRVEVLKGPQGTLYGSGSLAGTVRLIPNQPQFDRFESHVQGQGSVTESSGEPNGAFDAVLNAPLSDNHAVRVAVGYEHLGGFIDAASLIQREDPGDPLSAPVLRVPTDPRSGFVLAPVKEDTNDSDQWFVRTALRWQATSAVDVEVGLMHQTTQMNDAQVSNPNYHGGTYNFDSTGISPNSAVNYREGGKYRHTYDRLASSENEVSLGSLVVNAGIESASLTSSTSYHEIKADEWAAATITTQLFNPDGTIAFNYYDYFGNYPRANLSIQVDSKEEAFTQEVRVVSDWEKPINYVLGAYYQHQQYSAHIRDFEPGYTAYLQTVNGPGLPRPKGDLQYDQPEEGFRFEDTAIFGELSAHLSPQWQITGGVRFFWQDFRISPIAFNYFFDGAGTVDYDVDIGSEVNDHILKFNTSYELTPEFMFYANYSEGFRRGGANTAALDGPFATLPSLMFFEPDTSTNYEIGAKGSLLDGKLRYGFAMYRIDLDNFQFSGISGAGFPIILNGRDARSEGVELDSQIQLSHQLQVTLSYAYMNAKTRAGFQIDDLIAGALLIDPEDPPVAPIAIVPGDARLPTVPEHSVTAAVDYSRPLGTAEISLHADLAYRSSAPGFIDEDSDRFWTVPSHVLVNARLDYALNSNWRTSLFVNNLTDSTSYSGAVGTQVAPNPWAARYVMRPRTLGLGIQYSF